MASVVANSASKAGLAIDGMGSSMEKGADKLTRAEGRMLSSIKKATRELEMLGKTASQKFELQLDFRGLDRSKFQSALADLRKMEEATKGVGNAASASSLSILDLAKAGASLFAANHIVRGAKDAIAALYEASAAVERLRIGLDFASTRGSAAEIAYLRNTTYALGLEFKSTAQAYMQFQAAARGTALEGGKARDVFESVAKASAVMGLSASQSSGVLLALQQMISKGTVQAEELRGQLGERLPGAFQIAARAMGVTTAELGKMLEQGQVIADDFLPKFAKALNENIGDSAEKAANRLDAATNRFNDAFDRIKQSAGDTGISQFWAGQVNILTDAMNDVSNSMDAARASGKGFTRQMIAGAGSVLAFVNPLNAFSYTAQDVGTRLKDAESELDRLKRSGAEKSSNLMLREAFAHAQRLVDKYREAKTAQDALLGVSAGSDPRDQSGYKSRGASYQDYARQQAESEKALMDVRMRASGVNKQYFADLKVYEEALKNGVISQEKYIEEVSALAKRTFDASAAGKALKQTAQSESSAQREIAAIQAKIKLEEEYTARLRERGTAAEKATEGERLAAKLQEELAGKLDAKTRKEKEALLVVAQMLGAAQRTRTEEERQAKAIEDSEKAYRKYLDTLQKSADTIGNNADQQEAANATYGKSKTAIEELTLAQMKLALENEKDAGPWSPEALAKMEEAVRQQQRYVDALYKADYTKVARSMDEALAVASEQQVVTLEELSLIGQTELERRKIIAAREIELELAKELREIDKQTFDGTAEENERKREELRAKARQKARVKTETAIARETLTEWQKTADQINQSLTDALMRGFEDGKGFAENLRDAVQNMFKTMVLRPIISAVMAPVSGVVNGVVQGFIGGNAQGGGNGVMGTLGMASNAYSAYNALTATGGNLGAIGGWMGGSMSTANMAGSLYANTTATGIDGLLATNGAYGTAAGAGSAGAGGAGAGASYAAGAYAAIAAVVLNALGAFRSKRTVGGGLRGTLGDGDLTPYTVVRDGGTLFSGPDFRIEDEGKRIADLERRLEDLRASGQGASREAYETQETLNARRALYDPMLAAAKKQSDDIQAAYDKLRDNVGNMADALGLGSDKVRDFTMAFGTDEVHPDLNAGVGVDTQGLTAEEAAAKIAEALATANNTLAEQVIGRWETTTETVRRTRQDRGPIDGDLDIPGIYSEYEEVITGTHYVASEFARDGEQAIDTLTRLATHITNVNSVFETLGFTLYDASLAGADAANRFADLLGGLDNFNAVTSSYYQNFYSESERLTTARAAVNKQLSDLGVNIDLDSMGARTQYRSAVEAAMAAAASAQDEGTTSIVLKDTGKTAEETAAALLELNSAFAAVTTSVDATVAALPALGQTASGLASTISSAMLGTFSGGSVGAAMAASVQDGIYNAIAGGFAQQISNILVQGIVTPVVTAAMTGANATAAVSAASIGLVVEQAKQMVSVAAQVMQELQSSGLLSEISNAIGSIQIPTMRAATSIGNYNSAVSNSAREAAEAAERIKEAWADITTSLLDQVKLIRGEIAQDAGHGMDWWQAQFTIDTAMARAGDQDAAGRLASVSDSLLAVAANNAASLYELQSLRASVAQSLQDTAAYANAYANGKSVPRAAPSSISVALPAVQAIGATPIVVSSDPSVVAELRALRDDNKAQAGEIARLNLRVAKLLERWEGDGLPPTREETLP